MSLPRRPSVGLPSTPRARSFTAGQARQDIIPRPGSSASERPPPSSYYHDAPPLPPQPRTLRPARSIGALSVRPTGSVRSRSLDRKADRHGSTYSEPPPPLPAMPALPRGPRVGTAQRREIPAHTSSRSVDYNAYRSRERPVEPISDSSSSSDGSARSPTSIASSRTSMDEAEMVDEGDRKPAEGAGSSLWASISNLTINVSKAWSGKIATYNGEDTPVGGESRLTRAMKAYHIDKARDPADLPDWLFDERERGVRSHQASTGAPEKQKQKQAAQTPRPSELSRSVTTVRHDEPLPPARIARGPTLADRKTERRDAYGDVSGPGSDAHVTKSMARLRQLRDAKRNAKVRFGDDPEEEDGSEAVPRPPPVAHPVVERREPRPQRVPPPTTPRGMPAAPLGASLGVRGRQPSTRMGLPSGVRPVRA
ncbi:hypothetical protein C8Q76DRAFT_625676 [Earliella scabrosa]|nr:hypothetical protein C8Q76DRAFT_625676 [Earliella scabrosa]